VITSPADRSAHDALRVVLFSGGRGSGALATALVRTPGVALTMAINGYDDGASTGEVRRFLGDALGPSDFRKNASRLASALESCDPALVRLLDHRLPDGAMVSDVEALATALTREPAAGNVDSAVTDVPQYETIPHGARVRIAERLQAFLAEHARSGRSFRFGDCAVGNIVFAGAYLLRARRFNEAVDDYAALVGLETGLIENVTDGTNAFLVAIDRDGRVLGSEAEIVDATQRNAMEDIFLVARPLGPDECSALAALGPHDAAVRLRELAVATPLNSRLLGPIASADLLIYAPGTQHSSLFPSYLTPGLAPAIAANLHAIKLLITNIQTDAEIAGSSAVDLVGRAVHYLKEKGRLGTPTPALVTHFLMNDPRGAEPPIPYVPLGRLDTLQDPRLVRIGQYEEGATGRHDAVKVLAPFVRAVLDRREHRRRVAVVLYDAGSVDKLALTLIEMVRGGIADLPLDVTVFYEAATPLDAAFAASLPFAVERSDAPGVHDRTLRDRLKTGLFEYVVLFESSGMYNGEDIPWLASHLTGRLDAVWGSRRLSVRDVQESLRVKYRHRALLRAASQVGSYALSLSYLALYGRYVSDTLSGARAVRVDDACSIDLPLTHKRANQELLSGLLRRKAEMFEVPVHFYSVSPDHAKRTTVMDGLQSIGSIVWARFRPRPAEHPEHPKYRAYPAQPEHPAHPEHPAQPEHPTHPVHPPDRPASLAR
jgi:2-phospho-L-lactate transferase/gluconeogenesis factor (CofD/UPF0052 family)